MHNHTGCICLIFLHYESSNVSSKHLHKRMQNHTGCICLTFLSLHCVFSNVDSKSLQKRMRNHTGCICLVFLHCVFLDASTNYSHEGMQNLIGCTCLTHHQFLSLWQEILYWHCFCSNYQGFDPSLQRERNGCLISAPMMPPKYWLGLEESETYPSVLCEEKGSQRNAGNTNFFILMSFTLFTVLIVIRWGRSPKTQPSSWTWTMWRSSRWPTGRGLTSLIWWLSCYIAKLSYCYIAKLSYCHIAIVTLKHQQAEDWHPFGDFHVISPICHIVIILSYSY